MEGKKKLNNENLTFLFFLKALIRLFDQCANRVLRQPITQDSRHISGHPRNDPTNTNINIEMIEELRAMYSRDPENPILPLSIYTDLSKILKVTAHWLDQREKMPNQAIYNNPPIFPSEQFIPAPTGFYF